MDAGDRGADPRSFLPAWPLRVTEAKQRELDFQHALPARAIPSRRVWSYDDRLDDSSHPGIGEGMPNGLFVLMLAMAQFGQSNTGELHLTVTDGSGLALESQVELVSEVNQL